MTNEEKDRLKNIEEINPNFDWMSHSELVVNTEEEDLEWQSVSKKVDKGLNARMIIGIIIGLIILTLAALTSYGQTKKEVYNYIKATDIKHPEIVYAQAMLETGNLDTTKSKIYKENHNLFGMKEPKTRLTYATGTNRKHATYNSWRYSILDYSLWQKTFYKGGDYYQFLKSVGYATSKTYIEKLKGIKTNV